jgi:undecaprenyl-diphosphatase
MILRTRKANNMQEPTQDLARAAKDEIGYIGTFLRRHGWQMALWFVCLLLPVWVFADLMGEVHEHETFAFDAPILETLHGMSSPALDRFFTLVSRIGFLWGTIPLDVIVVVWLAWRRRLRDSMFFSLAVIGSALLDVAGKAYFERSRPDLWLSITPEYSYSFPSGHAMGSATLGLALTVLCWPTRWRWPVLIVATAFVLLVGLSRIYLGVHYPSDILAGWCAATAWVFGMHALVLRGNDSSSSAATSDEDTSGQGSADR